MATLTNKEYHDMREAQKRGDDKEVERILNGGTVIDVEVVDDSLDAEMIQDKLDSGMTKAEIGKQFGITHQKVSALLKAGGE